jgi:5-methylcytosine-specific restriction endonuclease McrA
MKDWQLKRNYNITLADYCNMFLLQDGCCAICGNKNQSNTKYPLIVDHSHVTDKVRGLLCPKCNLGLGHFQDNTELLCKAIDYLEKQ